MVSLFVAVAFASCFAGTTAVDPAGIQNLMGEPDYRQVRLHWEAGAGSIPDSGYQIKYCEMQTWGAQRCRTRIIDDNAEDNTIAGIRGFSVDIKGLRMATTYSFEVKTQEKGREDRAEANSQNVIVIPTKGFSAKATQCLPDASEIEVATGPHFGGRIAVEAADGERCALDGEPDSPRDTYTLRINHTRCGSQVNDTTVSTFVIVQENLPILTHSTRRFLVLCSYQPETLTVRAGLNLPAGGVQDADGSARRPRRGRLLQKPEALVDKVQSQSAETTTMNERTKIIPIFVMLGLVGVIGFVAIVLKISARKLLTELDNVSISSDLSNTSSICSSVDLENPIEKQQYSIKSKGYIHNHCG